MVMKSSAWFLFLGLTSFLFAQIPSLPDSAKAANPYGRKYPPRIYFTQKLKGKPPFIDGRLNDACWNEGEWAGNFVQQIPVEGAKPSAETEMKILYDEKNLYAAFRSHDDPAKIHRYKARRDGFAGDVVGVCLDSYGDKRTGFEFDLTAGGGKIDLVLMNAERDCSWDTNWDAVWYGRTAMEDSAWTAEFRIPLSQLRYGPQDEQVWGMHAWRYIDRNQEEDQWNLIPRNNTGRMYNIGELRGIRGLKRFRHIELLPHVLGKLRTDPRESGNPYATGTDAAASAGLDLKIGLSSDFTLDATFNPDFGQVEADPSVMNLTAYETFYQEKRPFFLEGKNILDFNLGDGMLFYTRRIGHAPSYSPRLLDGEYVKTQESTGILNALKITGKNRDGLSLGVVQSVTSRETARISSMGVERRQTVEPLSNYFVGRVQKDWDKGNTSLGGIFTSTHRWIRDDALDFLPRDAFTGGMDFVRYFHNRSYVLSARAVFSGIYGNPEAMLNLQTDPAHFFQRPDAKHLDTDSSASSISGHGGALSFGSGGNGKWRYSESVTWFSPGLDLNDLGFLQRADLVRNEASVGYAETEPRGILRTYSADLYQMFAWDFGGLRTDATLSFNVYGQFTNKWSVNWGLYAVMDQVDTRLLRGGPAMRLGRFLCNSVYAGTDNSRKIVIGIGVHNHTYADGISNLNEIYPDATLRLSDAMTISGEFRYSLNKNDLQYVSTAAVGNDPRYILGKIDQKTVSATFRLDYHLTNDFSIQYYGSPFISAGRYSDFKKTASPLARKYEERFHRFGPDEIAYRTDGKAYDVRETDAPAAVYSFGNPDFSFREFRSNLVIRWEYKPGSALYLVWSQQRNGYESVWRESVGDNFCSLWNADAHNVFLAKLSYWFSL
jgi:hypothetical protein